MTGEHDQPSLVQVRRNQVGQHAHPGFVHGDKWLIQHPQAGVTQGESGQGDTTFLSLRQMPHQLPLPTSQAKTGEHLLRSRGVGRSASQSGGKGKVLLDGHGFLEGIEVAEIAQILAKGVALIMNGHAIPENLARFDRRQTAHHAQQAGFSNAIGTSHIQPSPGFQRAVNVLKKLSPAPAAAELGKGQYWLSFQFLISQTQGANLTS